VSGILVEKRGAALWIVNNNPGARNALTVEFVQGVPKALAEAAGDPGVAAVVMVGAEGFFCAGGDLNVLIKRREMTIEDRVAGINVLHDMIRAIRACPKPVIACVEGGAAGAGAPIALACDLLVAARDAYFAVSYLRVGLAPDGGSTAFLSDGLPRQLVNEMIMFGDRITAERLHALGVVNRVVEPGTAEAEAQALAERLNNTGPEALAVAKRLILSATGAVDAQLDAEAQAMALSQGGQESAEGISAFLEKRKADFTRFRR
jgi:enoyl-CoA hydratase/carnithine racemase